jgi:hypothetical protein
MSRRVERERGWGGDDEEACEGREEEGARAGEKLRRREGRCKGGMVGKTSRVLEVILRLERERRSTEPTKDVLHILPVYIVVHN